MDTADIWASMYVFPVITVIGVFILAGAVYFLSFRSKDDATDQSLKNYLDVLSGDDDKNRKAAKRLRKFGNSRQKSLLNGSGGYEEEGTHSEYVTERKDVRSTKSADVVDGPLRAGRFPSTATVPLVSKNLDPVVSAVSANGFIPGSSDGREYFITELFDSAAPEIATCDDHGVAGRERTTVEDDREVLGISASNKYPLSTHSREEGLSKVTKSQVSVTEVFTKEAAGSARWHKAVSRKDKKQNNGMENKSDDTTNHSTTSDESRPSFKNSCSSRNSSPQRHLTLTSHPTNDHTRKFTSRKALAKPAYLLQQRPDHSKTESSNQATCYGSGNVTASPPTRPTILLTKATENHIPLLLPFTKVFPRTFACGKSRDNKIPPLGGVDISVQTEEDKDYPSPLEGLRRVDNGEPRYVIMMDFSVQVDLDSDDGLEPEIAMHEDGDKSRYSSGASLSSGDGSARVTPVMEHEYAREFRSTAEKSQGVHRRSVSDSVSSSRYPVHEYPQQLASGNPKCDDGGGDAEARHVVGTDGRRPYFSARNDLRTCRAEKASTDWIDNSSRRGRPVNGRWRN